MLLSDMQCRAAKPRLKPFKLSDGKGLYLEVMPSGAKYWRLKYHYNGTEKRISFGSYPAISLQEAREKRTSAKKEITTGQDPILVRLQEKQTRLFNASQTFERIALEWHEKEAAAWNERYAKLVLHRLEKYVFPDLGVKNG